MPPDDGAVRDDRVADASAATPPGSCTFERLCLDLSSQSVSDISGLEQFPSLQSVDVSANAITSVAALTRLEQLRRLDASRNRLTVFPDFAHGSSSDDDDDDDAIPRLLTTVDLSFNRIATIRDDIGRLRYLTELNLQANALASLRWCRSLTNLQTLNVAGNQIADLDGLEGARLLTDLNISSNAIESMRVSAPIPTLRYLDASGNRIGRVDGIGLDLPSLAVLSLSGNAVVWLDGLADLANLPLLRELDLTGNEIGRADQYRSDVVFLLPDLECLDQDRVTALEILQSEIRHARHPDVFRPSLSAQCAVMSNP